MSSGAVLFNLRYNDFYWENLGGLDESASGISQAKSPTKVGLAPGDVLQSRLAGKLPLHSPGVSAGEMRHRPVHVLVSLREALRVTRGKQWSFIFREINSGHAITEWRILKASQMYF